MATWADVMQAGGSIAEVAASRLMNRVAYLATIRADGSPRVHPVTPRVHEGQLFVRMNPTSPKTLDLRREPRYALHSSVDDDSGAGGEMLLFGRAEIIDDDAWVRSAFADLSNPNPASYTVFLLDIDDVRLTLYEDDKPLRVRWPVR